MGLFIRIVGLERTRAKIDLVTIAA